MRIQMNLAIKLAPNKYFRICDSLVAVAGLVHQTLKSPMTTDELWTALQSQIKEKQWPTNRISFQTFWAALLVLYSIGAIDSPYMDIVTPAKSKSETSKTER